MTYSAIIFETFSCHYGTFGIPTRLICTWHRPCIKRGVSHRDNATTRRHPESCTAKALYIIRYRKEKNQQKNQQKNNKQIKIEQLWERLSASTSVQPIHVLQFLRAPSGGLFFAQSLLTRSTASKQYGK